MEPGIGQGRPASIPEWAYVVVFGLHADGYGYTRIATMLESLAISTTKSSVHRLLAGLPPYGSRRIARLKKRVVYNLQVGAH